MSFQAHIFPVTVVSAVAFAYQSLAINVVGAWTPPVGAKSWFRPLYDLPKRFLIHNSGAIGVHVKRTTDATALPTDAFEGIFIPSGQTVLLEEDDFIGGLGLKLDTTGSSAVYISAFAYDTVKVLEFA
jgi:hypothetical protein